MSTTSYPEILLSTIVYPDTTTPTAIRLTDTIKIEWLLGILSKKLTATQAVHYRNRNTYETYVDLVQRAILQDTTERSKNAPHYDNNREISLVTVSDILNNTSMSFVEALYRMMRHIEPATYKSAWQRMLIVLMTEINFDDVIFTEDVLMKYKYDLTRDMRRQFRLIYWNRALSSDFQNLNPLSNNDIDSILEKRRTRYRNKRIYPGNSNLFLHKGLLSYKYRLLYNRGLPHDMNNIVRVQSNTPRVTKYINTLYNQCKLSERLLGTRLNVSTNYYQTIEHLQNVFHETYGKKLEPDGFKFISYKSMVEDYFKGFTFDYSINAPRLSKQLKAAGFNPSHKEIVYFGEVRKFFKVLSNHDHGYLPDAFLYVDTTDFEIPNDVDDWAFADSCHNYSSRTGSHTHYVLKALGINYLKIYKGVLDPVTLTLTSSHTPSNVPCRRTELAPFARAYFYKDHRELAHAGGYVDDTHAPYQDDDESYYSPTTNYELITVLLCILFDRRIDDFTDIEGFDIENTELVSRYWHDQIKTDPLFDDLDADHLYCNFWANMSSYCDYLKLGTSELLSELSLDSVDLADIIDTFD